MKILLSILLILTLTGCAHIHYKNKKCFKVDAKDINTPIGSFQDGEGNFCSELEIWVPWPFKEAS